MKHRKIKLFYGDTGVIDHHRICMLFISTKKLFSNNFFCKHENLAQNFKFQRTVFCSSSAFRFRSIHKFTPCRLRFKIRYFVVAN